MLLQKEEQGRTSGGSLRTCLLYTSGTDKNYEMAANTTYEKAVVEEILNRLDCFQQEPMTTCWMGMPAASSTVLVLEGRWGRATVGRRELRSMTTSRS